MRVLVLIGMLCPSLATAQAGATFYPPEGCTGVLTVQSRSCEVDHIYTCSQDAAGDQWRVTFTAEGIDYLSKIDAETQWIESYDFFPNRRKTLILPAEDPASLSELMATGLDSYDFTQNTPDGVERVVGFDRLTGEEVVIDGEPLLRTEFSARHILPSGQSYTVRGGQYVSKTHGRFFSGTWIYDGEPDIRDDNTPVDFIYPGEPGFFHKTPLYDCEANLASFALPAGGDYP